DAVVDERRSQRKLPASVTSGRRQRREVAGETCSGRNVSTRVVGILPDRCSLIAAKEKQLVVNNWSTDGSTELVPLQRIVRRCEIVSRVEQIVPDEFKQVAVELVGSGFRDGTDSGRFWILGRQAAGLDFEFLQCIGKRQWLALAIVWIHVRDAVE